MNNSDSPAMPCRVTINRNTKKMVPTQVDNNDFLEFGLTKREHFAGLAMQGMLSDESVAGTAQDVAACAVMQADALLKELDK